MGVSKRENCFALYECIQRTGCAATKGQSSIQNCLCSQESLARKECDGKGACGTQELGALESASDPNSVTAAHKNMLNAVPGHIGYCGAALNVLYTCAFANDCADASP
jgi:hypothetical protein